MRSVRSSAAASALIAGFSMGISGPASAAGWLAPASVPLSASDLAVDAQGDAVAVGKDGIDHIRASTRTFGGAWNGSTALSSAGDSLVTAPKVSVDQQGNAVAVWSAYSFAASARVIRVASRPVGGSWSAPVRLSNGAASFGGDYGVATDLQGNTTVVWTELSDSTYVLKVASLPRSGSWADAGSVTTALTSNGEGNVFSPDVAVGDNGALTVAWIGFKPGPVNLVRSRSRSRVGGGWTSTRAVSSDGLAEAPQVAVDRHGNSTVLWAQNAGGHKVRAARQTAAGHWSSETQVGEGRDPQIAVEANGNATAIWVAPASSGSSITTSTSANGGPWGAHDILATTGPAGDVQSPWLGTDTAGNVTAIWARVTSGLATAEVARRWRGDDWQHEDSLPVGQLSAFPAAAIDWRGHVTLAWTGPAALPGTTSIFDPVAPELREFAVPTSAGVGQSISVSVAPFDVSTVTTRWDFGDGAFADGAAASHVYGAPGWYTVMMTATDAAGNTARASHAVVVSPAFTDDLDPRPDPKPDPKPKPIPTFKAPVLSGLRQTSVRWTTGKRRGSRLPVGSVFRFRLDRAAQVRLAFAEIASGRRDGKRCVPATKANRGKQACVLQQARGTVRVAGNAGANRVTFRGTVGGRTLKPGRYRVQVTASADGKRSKTATKTFTIVR